MGEEPAHGSDTNKIVITISIIIIIIVINSISLLKDA